MRNLFAAFACCLLLISCKEQAHKNEVDANDPNLVHVQSDDDEMNKAIAKAQDTYAGFVNIIREKKYDEGVASVKLRYPVPDGGGEHIWATDLFVKGDNIYGVIDNEPARINNIKMGDTVLIEQAQISDWVYGEKGILRGGYTIRVLRNQMSPQERKQFDEEFSLKIEE